MGRAIRDLGEQVQLKPLSVIVTESAARVLATKSALGLGINSDNVHLYLNEALRIKDEYRHLTEGASSSHPHREVGLGILTLLRLDHEYNENLVLEIKESRKRGGYTIFDGFEIAHRSTAPWRKAKLNDTFAKPIAFSYYRKVSPK